MRRSLFFLLLLLGLLTPSFAGAQDSIHSKNGIQKLTDPKTRDAAAQVFRLEGSRWLSKAPKLLELYGRDPSFNEVIVSILKEMGTSLVPLLKKEIRTAKGLRFECALKAIQALGPRAIPLFPLLSEEAQRGDTKRRRQILETISYLPSESATPILRVALRDKNSEVASTAARALGQLGRYGRGGVPALLAQLSVKENEASLTATIIESLGKIGLTSRGVAPALLKSLSHKAPEIRGAAMIALARNHWDATVLKAPVLKALSQSNKNLRLSALKTLELLGLKGRFAKEKLESLFVGERSLRLPVFSAYIAVDRESRFGIYELLAMFPRETPEFRVRALQLLAKAGPRNPVIISELFKIAKADKSLDARKEAMSVLATYSRFNETRRTGLIRELINSAPTVELKCHGIALYSRHAPKTAAARSFLIDQLKKAGGEETRTIVKALMNMGRGGKAWVQKEALRTPALLSFECGYQWVLSGGTLKKERRAHWTTQLVLGMKRGEELKDWRRVSLGLQMMAGQSWTDEPLAAVARCWVKDPRDRYRRWAYQFLGKNSGEYQQDLFPGLKDPWTATKREVALSFLKLTEPKKALLKTLDSFMTNPEMGLEVAAVLLHIGKGSLQRKARRRLELSLGQVDFRGLRLFQQLKERTTASVSELAKDLSNADPRYRIELARTLAFCKGGEAKALLEVLFKDPVARVKAAAIEALVLQRQFQKNPAFEKILLPLLKSDAVPIQKASIWALGKMGSTKSKRGLFDFQESPHPELRQAAAVAAASLGKESFAPLRMALSRRESRAWGGLVIRNLESKWAGDLVRNVKDQPYVVRRAVCEALGDGSPDIFPRLLPLLRKDDSAAKLAWEVFGEHGEDAIECMIAEVSGGHERGLESAARALRIIGAASVPPLMTLVRSENVKLRRYGVRALGIVGSVNSRVGTALLGALEDKDLRVRAEAAGGLGSCVLPEQRSLIVSGLLRALKDPSRKIRVKAVMSFGRLGDVVAEVAVPELKKTLKSWDKTIRRESLRALASMGKKRLSCLPEIVAALKDQDALVRRAAVETLSQFGAAGEAALKELDRVATVDKDVPARLAAAQAIETIKEAIQKSPLEKK